MNLAVSGGRKTKHTHTHTHTALILTGGTSIYSTAINQILACENLICCKNFKNLDITNSKRNCNKIDLFFLALRCSNPDGMSSIVEEHSESALVFLAPSVPIQ